jgi:hypothetical protein
MNGLVRDAKRYRFGDAYAVHASRKNAAGVTGAFAGRE